MISHVLVDGLGSPLKMTGIEVAEDEREQVISLIKK